MEKIVKKCAVIIIFILCFMFILRCCMVADKSTFDELYITDRLRDAYSDGELVIKTVNVEEEIADDGYFCAYALFYSPETGDVQITVRWNDSVYDYTDMATGHEYSFYILNETTGERFPATAIDSIKKTLYNYRKLSAENVNVSEGDRLTVVMELRDGFESTQVVRYGEQPFKEYKIPKKLLAELVN